MGVVGVGLLGLNSFDDLEMFNGLVEGIYVNIGEKNVRIWLVFVNTVAGQISQVRAGFVVEGILVKDKNSNRHNITPFFIFPICAERIGNGRLKIL